MLSFTLSYSLFKLTALGVMSLALIVSKFQLFQNPID